MASAAHTEPVSPMVAVGRTQPFAYNPETGLTRQDVPDAAQQPHT
jgi:hypothetical protein